MLVVLKRTNIGHKMMLALVSVSQALSPMVRLSTEPQKGKQMLTVQLPELAYGSTSRLHQGALLAKYLYCACQKRS